MQLSEMTDGEARAWWLGIGGKLHGPKLETATIAEADLLPHLRKMAAVCCAADALDRAVDGIAIHAISTKSSDVVARVVGAKRAVQDAINALTSDS